MSRRPPSITLRIDRVTVDRRGLGEAELARALRREIDRVIADRGPAGLGRSGDRPAVRAGLPPGEGALARRVASAVIKGVKS